MSKYRLDAIHNGQRFYDTWVNEVRWVEDAGTWYAYRASEHRWTPSDEDVREMGKLVVADMYDEGMTAIDRARSAGDTNAEAAAKATLKWAKTTADTQFDKMLKMASSIDGMRIQMTDFDAQHYYLNTLDGVWDLRTGRRVSDVEASSLLLTKRTGASPESDWQGGEWQNFLNYVCPNEEVRGYLQLCMGYMAFAGVEERLILFLLGDTGCGKSKFVEAVQSAMGDYAVSLATDQLLVGAKDTYGLARLPGARMIQAAEFEEGQKINTSLVKRITSGEPVTVRMAYGKPFDYSPVGTIIISTNKLPWLGDDEAGWNRVRAIPFNESLTLYNVERLDDKLSNARGEVLKWILEGAAKYWSTEPVSGSRLTPPQVVAEVTGGERRDQRHYVLNMLEECFDGDQSYYQEAGDVYAVLKAWCGKEGFKEQEIVKKAWMGRKFAQDGVPAHRTAKARWWGVGRLTDDGMLSSLAWSSDTVTRLKDGWRWMA